MSSNKKRILAAALAAVLTVSLTACSSSGNNSSNSSSDAGNSSSTPSDTTEPKTHTLTILGRDPTNDPVKWEDRDQYPTWIKLEELFQSKGLNLEYELVAPEQYTVVIQTRMAAGSKLPDIANITPLDNPTAITLAKQGVILELTELIDQYSDGTINNTIDTLYPNSKGLVRDEAGKQYWFPSLHRSNYWNNGETGPARSIYAMTIRKDWLDKLNLEDPTTAEEFYEVMKAFREQDVNGNGKADEVLILDPSSFNTGIAQWFGLAPGLFGVDITNGKVVSPWYQEGVKDYFAYMQKLTEAGILDTTGLANITETTNQRCTENQMAADFNYSTQAWNERMCVDKDAYYMPLPPLPAKEGVTPYVLKEDSTLTWQKYVITKACKDLEGAIALFDVLYSPEYADLAGYGVEGVRWDQDENGVPIIRDFSGIDPAPAESFHGRKLFAGYMLPIMQNMKQSTVSTSPDVRQEKWDYNIEYVSYEPWYADSNDNFLAMATSEENDEIAAIITEATTYSEELSTKLILGQINLDDFDAQVAKFKDLKLDRLLEI